MLCPLPWAQSYDLLSHYSDACCSWSNLCCYPVFFSATIPDCEVDSALSPGALPGHRSSSFSYGSTAGLFNSQLARRIAAPSGGAPLRELPDCLRSRLRLPLLKGQAAARLNSGLCAWAASLALADHRICILGRHVCQCHHQAAESWSGIR